MIFKKLLKIDSIKSLQLFQIIRYVSLLLIGILLVKIGFSTEQVGIYETLMIIGSSISFFWISGIIQVMLSSNKESSNSKSPVYFNTFIILQILSVLGFVVVSLFSKPISQLFLKQDSIPFISILSYYVLLIGPTCMIEYILLLQNKSKSILYYGAISYLFQILSIILPALLFNSLEYSIYGLLSSAILRYGWLLLTLRKYAVFNISIEFIKQHLYLATPLILTALLSGSAEYIDSIIISNHFNAGTFAIYRYGAKEFPIVLLLATAFSNAIVPQIARAETLSTVLVVIKDKSQRMMHLLFPITIILMLISNKAYPIIFNQNFAESAGVFNIYLLLIISRLVFPQSIVIGLKQTRIILISALIEILLNAGLSLILIQRWGINGVAIATVIAYFVDKAILTVYNIKKNKILPTEYIPVKTLSIYSLVLLTALILTY